MSNLAIDNSGLREQIVTPLHRDLVGVSPFIREVRDLVARLGPSDLCVLISGETGTGKDIVAQLLHKHSPRRTQPYIKVNCPAVPNELLESELFGYEKGAFTGALTSKPGHFELADKGTIFLDEITETSQVAQGKLLIVLDGEPFMRIGGVRPVTVDVRVVAATNVPLDKAVELNKLRKDVCFRLSEVVIHMLPLRERPEDIPVLVEHFNHNFSQQYGKPYTPVPRAVVHQLQGQQWHGNVRELAARIKEYVATGAPSALLEQKAGRGEGDSLRTPRARAGHGDTEGESIEKRFMPLKEATRRKVEETERTMIEEALRYTLWNRRKAAKLLQISYSSLLRRIDAYDIGNG